MDEESKPGGSKLYGFLDPGASKPEIQCTIYYKHSPIYLHKH